MYVTPEEITKAQQVDLLTYLSICEPDNLIKESINSYCTKEHDSLKISNGKWNWFSQKKGGKNAIDYLVAVRGYTFQEAAIHINKRVTGFSPAISLPQNKPYAEKIFTVPEMSNNTSRAFNYLARRGINTDLIEFCIKKGYIFETRKYHNVAFAGYDENGQMKYLSLRGTTSKAFKGDVYGSKKEYSFRICENKEADTVHLFESAIDLLSHITLQIIAHKQWQHESYLSVAGVSVKNIELPKALSQYLSKNKTSHIYLHFDNDRTGMEATNSLKKLLEDKYEVTVCFPVLGKDVNEELMILTGRKNNFLSDNIEL